MQNNDKMSFMTTVNLIVSFISSENKYKINIPLGLTDEEIIRNVTKALLDVRGMESRGLI